MNYFIELVTFKAKAGVTPDQVISASDDVNHFLKSQHGFVSRNLGQTEDGTWHDILYWESQAHVMAAMEKVAASSSCATFFGLIDPDSDSMALFPSLMSIGK